MRGGDLFLSLLLVAATARGADHYNINRQFSAAENPAGAWSYGWKEHLRGDFHLLEFHRTQSDESGTRWHVWEYQTYGVHPAFIYFPRTNTSTVFTGDGGQYPPGTLVIATGDESTPQNFVVLRFTARHRGIYRITTAVRSHLDRAPSGDTDFHVLHNDRFLFQRFLDPASQASFSRLLFLSPGDTIDFAMGRGRDGAEFGSALKIKAVVTRRGGIRF